MIRRILPVALIAALLVSVGLQSTDGTAAEKKKGFVALKSLEKDFFVAAGDKAVAAHQGAGLRTRYWDWTLRDGEVHYQKYCGTPPEHMLFALRKALDLLLEEGLVTRTVNLS